MVKFSVITFKPKFETSLGKADRCFFIMGPAFCFNEGIARLNPMKANSGNPRWHRRDDREAPSKREIILKRVSQNGQALGWFGTGEMRGDREIVMTAVSQDGLALQHATEELRGRS